MSAVSTVYDSLVARVGAVLTSVSGWAELPNPYEIQENPDNFLRQAWAVSVGAGTNTKRTLSSRLSTRREFLVTVTRVLDATEFNVSTKRETEKQLLEDLRLVVGDLEANTTLNNGSHVVAFESDNGIEFVNGEDESFLFVQATVSVEYFESY